MNLKDLSKLEAKDIKNLIGQGQLKDQLLGQPATIINIILIILTIGVGISSFRSYKTNTKNLTHEIVELEKKSEALDKFELVRNQHNDFKAEIPKYISENKLIEMLSEIAIRSGVQIVSFSPANKKKNNFINLTQVEITITSTNYEDIVRFMHDIENSTYSIRIAGWSGISKDINQKTNRRRNRQVTPVTQSKSQKIEASIKIETLDFKNE